MNYDLFRGLHILAVIAWMAGLLYLPRLFAYHAKATQGSELDTTFQTMELKLYRIIMNPAMIAAYVFGIGLIYIDGSQRLGWSFLHTPWMTVKVLGIVFMTGWHHFLGRARKAFVRGENTHSDKFWRAVNELPFLAAIVMVLAVTMEWGR